MLNLLKRLCACNGVSSWEDEVRALISEEIAPYVTELRTDSIGNLIAFKKGKTSTGSDLMLTAHMDEVGLMLTQIDEDGMLRFDSVGSIDRRVLIGKPVYIGKNHIPGVIGLKPIHLTTREERKQVPKMEELYIDIGVSSREEAEKLVSRGDPAAFDPESVLFGQDRLKGKAVGSRIGCAVMMQLIREELPMDCTFVFTVQEEVGTRGAFGAAFGVKPKIALVLNEVSAGDIPGVSPVQQGTALGQGPVISLIDSGTIYDRSLFETLRSLAVKHQIPWQMEQVLEGKSDACTIQRSREGVRVAGLSVPVRNRHTPSSVADTKDAEHMLALARLFLQAMAEEY